MSKEISLFSGYSVKENRVTNYCLLMLRMIYEENPKFLQKVLSDLMGPDVANWIGVSFTQQTRKRNSVPDGIVFQRGVTIYIEAKNFDWFYDDQIDRHLDALSNEISGEKVLMALSNFEEDTADRFKGLSARIRLKYGDSVYFEAVSFESLVTALSKLPLDPKIRDAVREFEEFLNEESLLPSWKHWMDVINCSAIPEDVLEWGVYMCPALGQSYSHGRCKYFGMYRDWKIEKVALIEAVIDVDLAGDDYLKWQQGNEPAEALKARARKIVEERRPDDEVATRVFLLGELHDTHYSKAKVIRNFKYINVARLEPENVADLAGKLKNVREEELEAG